MLRRSLIRDGVALHAHLIDAAERVEVVHVGAAERRLPYEYQAYLHGIRPYRITTRRQQLGMLLYLAIWGPIFILLLQVLAPMFARKDGTLPHWLAAVVRFLFSASWASYDRVFRPVFGDGERTIGEGRDEDGDEGALSEKAPLIRAAVERYGSGGRLETV